MQAPPAVSAGPAASTGSGSRAGGSLGTSGGVWEGCSVSGVWSVSSAVSHVSGRGGIILGLGAGVPFSNWGFVSSQTIWRGFLLVTDEGGGWCASENGCQPESFQPTPRSSAGSCGANIWLSSKPVGCRPEKRGQEGSSRKSQDGGSRNLSFSPSMTCCKLQTNQGLIYVSQTGPCRALCLLRDKDGRR